MDARKVHGSSAYPTTMAWIAFREGRYVGTGVWLAPLIATKPTIGGYCVGVTLKIWWVRRSFEACAIARRSLAHRLGRMTIVAARWAEVNWLPFAFATSFWSWPPRGSIRTQRPSHWSTFMIPATRKSG